METQVCAPCEETTHVAPGDGAFLYSRAAVERTVRRPTLPTILGAISVACTGVDYEHPPDGDAPSRVTGMLFVERVEGGVHTGTQVGARFVRFVGVAEETLPELVGMPTTPRVGLCVLQGAPAGEALDPLRSEVRLLDVGVIDVTASGRLIQLHPRRFPDLWNVVSGVLYGTETDLPMGAWHFVTPGAPGLAALEVTGQAPEAPMDVRIGTTTLPLGETEAIALPARGRLQVRWAGVPGDDRITIRFEGDGALACGAADVGFFELDAANSDRARAVLRAGGTLSVHRVRTLPFTARGLDTATLVFDHSVRARARVE